MGNLLIVQKNGSKLLQNSIEVEINLFQESKKPG